MKRLTVVLFTVLIGTMLACSDESPTTPTPTTTLPDQAQFTFTEGDRDWWPNDDPNVRFWLTTVVTITETAGLGGNIDFVRLEGKNADGVYERSEIGADIIVDELGTNRIDARSTWSYTVGWNWNMPDAIAYKITVQVTDDRGNVSSLVSRDDGYQE